MYFKAYRTRSVCHLDFFLFATAFPLSKEIFARRLIINILDHI